MIIYITTILIIMKNFFIRYRIFKMTHCEVGYPAVAGYTSRVVV